MQGSEKILSADEASVQKSPSGAPRRRRSFGFWVGVIAVVVVISGSILMNILLLAMIFSGGKAGVTEEFVTGEASARQKIALMDVRGVIIDEDFWGRGLVRRVKEFIKRADEDPSVKAVILNIDSPGGGITASDILHREIVKLKSKKKVVVLMGDLATSGAYYISAPADWIVAHPTTVTGSIGVVLHGLNYQGLFEKIGLKEITIKSAEKKDILSPSRAMTPEEEAILKGLIGEMHERFLEVVKEGRKLKDEDLKLARDGRILSAKQALEEHLIDEIGYLDEAVQAAKRLSGISEAKVVRYKELPGLLGLLFGAKRSGGSLDSAILQGLFRQAGAKFMYLWVPGLARE